MSDHLSITDFLSPVNLHEISHSEGYKDGQIGQSIFYEEQFPDLDNVQVVIVGCGEQRDSGQVI